MNVGGLARGRSGHRFRLGDRPDDPNRRYLARASSLATIFLGQARESRQRVRVSWRSTVLNFFAEGMVGLGDRKFCSIRKHGHLDAVPIFSISTVKGMTVFRNIGSLSGRCAMVSWWMRFLVLRH